MSVFVIIVLEPLEVIKAMNINSVPITRKGDELSFILLIVNSKL